MYPGKTDQNEELKRKSLRLLDFALMCEHRGVGGDRRIITVRRVLDRISARIRGDCGDNSDYYFLAQDAELIYGILLFDLDAVIDITDARPLIYDTRNGIGLTFKLSSGVLLAKKQIHELVYTPPAQLFSKLNERMGQEFFPLDLIESVFKR